MDDLNTVRAALLARPGAQETYPFDPITLVAKVGGKMFALLATTAAPLRLSLKVDSGLRRGAPCELPGHRAGVADVATTLTFYEQAFKAQSAKRKAENRRAETALPA